MKNLLTNDYYKIYLRLLKEKNIYNNKELLSLTRYEQYVTNKKCGATPYKTHSLYYITDLPNNLISINTPYDIFLNIFLDYNNIIAPFIIRKLLKELNYEYDEKMFKNIQKKYTDTMIQIEDNVKSLIPKREFFDNLAKLLNKQNNYKNNITGNDIKNVMFNKTSRKITKYKNIKS